MTTEGELPDIVERCRRYAAVIKGITVVPDDWQDGETHREVQEPRATLLEAADLIERLRATPPGSPLIAEREWHYLSAIRKRLEQLYDASADNPRLREQLSDEVDWVDVQLTGPPAERPDIDALTGTADDQGLFAIPSARPSPSPTEREANDEMVEGFRDGYDRDAPEPSANRSNSYRHGFMVGRLDNRLPSVYGARHTADELRRLADEAMEADEARGV